MYLFHACKASQNTPMLRANKMTRCVNMFAVNPENSC